MNTATDTSTENRVDLRPVAKRHAVRLSPNEANLLSEQNHIIRIAKKGADKCFRQMGAALKIVRNQRLYRARYANFKAFCRGEHRMDDSYARHLIRAVEALENVETTGVKISSEAVLRPVLSLPPERQKVVLLEAYRRANGAPTAEVVREVRRELEPINPAEAFNEPKMTIDLMRELLEAWGAVEHAISGMNYASGLSSEDKNTLRPLLGRAQSAARALMGRVL